MPKVVHILNTGSFSGAENVVITILESLQGDKDYECTYVSLDGTIRNILEMKKLNYYLLDKMSIHNLNKMIKDINPDIIHCHDFTISILVSLLFKKIPMISHLHNNPKWIKSRNIKSIAYMLTLPRYSYVLGVSYAIYDEYIYKKRIKNYKVVSNPINLSQITAKKNTEKIYDIIFLGRLTEQKNPLRFINLIKQLSVFFPNVKVAMVGDGDLYEDSYQLVKNLKLEKNIYVFGFRSDRYEFINSSKIMCITSAWEGFGLMAIEGLAFGLPIVSTTVGGLQDIITDECGKLCHCDNDFILELKLLLSNEEYYNQKKDNSFKRAKQLENIDEYMNNLKILYNDVI